MTGALSRFFPFPSLSSFPCPRESRRGWAILTPEAKPKEEEEDHTPPMFPRPSYTPPTPGTHSGVWMGWVCQRLSPLPLSQKRHFLQWVGHQGSSETAELQPLLTLTTLCKRKPEAVKGKGVEGWGTRLGLEAFTQRMSYCPQGKGHHLCG